MSDGRDDPIDADPIMISRNTQTMTWDIDDRSHDQV